MKNFFYALSITGALSVSSAAVADSNKPIALWLCSDYLAVEDNYRPTVLGFAEAVNRKGEPQSATLDVDGITRVQPELLTFCKENPKIALRDALVQSWSKAKK
ncbi:acid-activated periplasmic chaperone HdeA [Achromobacter sp. Root565]|uniref:acid-activated periplasmic chaperone HdeA n=1 Tax=Achromobacter sp. Root565 TaxID=1736564 RepID=UPI0009EAA16D|nr:acid-activated periplasmic chaperone HdeA [Achromobacter sp. Root565]